MTINDDAELRFIRLGEESQWADICIREGTVRLGYTSPYHREAQAGNWGCIEQYWFEQRNGNRKTARTDVNQIRDFYTLTENDVWITFHLRKLFWCRAEGRVTELDDGTRIRNVIGEWSSQDCNGRQLTVESLDGRISRVNGYRQTICRVALPDYLIKKINGEKQKEIIDAENALGNLINHVEKLVQGLWWKDFELLVDLIFARSGWQRFSVLGKTEKDIDLDVFSPTTHKRAFVQIKSTATLRDVADYINRYRQHPQFDEMYFICHTGSENLSAIAKKHPDVHVWGGKEIARMVISSGATEWLISKRS